MDINEYILSISDLNSFSQTKDTPQEEKQFLVKLLKEGLVERIDNGKFRLSNDGFTALDYGYDNWIKQSSKDESVSREKNEVELELAKKTLKEFPKTKWFARIGFIISILLLLKELSIWIWQLCCQ